MVQALPFMAQVDEQNALSLSAALYANSIGAYIMKAKPQMKRVVDQWRMEKGNETSMMSNLEKNAELSQQLLSETPWTLDAQNEREQENEACTLLRRQQLDGTANFTQQFAGQTTKCQRLFQLVEGYVRKLCHDHCSGQDPGEAQCAYRQSNFECRNANPCFQLFGCADSSRGERTQEDGS